MENFTFWANIFCKLKAGWLALVFFWKCFQATVLSCVSFVFSLLGQTRGWLELPRPLTIFPDSIPSVAFEDSRASSCHLLMNVSSFFFLTVIVALAYKGYLVLLSCPRVANTVGLTSISWYRFTSYQELQEHCELLNTFVLNFDAVEMKL